MHFAKLSIFRFSKHYTSNGFGPISTKRYDKSVSGGEYRLLLLGTIWPNFFFLTKDPMVLEISKYYFYSFHPISGKRYEDIVYHGRILAITFLDSLQGLKNVVAL